MSYEIAIIPALTGLTDNYIYLIHDKESNRCAAVDPGDATPALDAASERGWIIDTILVTHPHYDHVGGILEIHSKTGAKVIGAKKDHQRIPMISRKVQQGDNVSFGKLSFRVLETPGHSNGHIIFIEDRENFCFVGDTLFVLGCGRLFDGTPAEMWDSLKKIKRLPKDMKFYCAHEYTETNVAFALTIDPDNQALIEFQQKVKALRAEGVPTVPALLGDEFILNPFLRSDDPEMLRLLDFPDTVQPVDIFTELRNRRNHF